MSAWPLAPSTAENLETARQHYSHLLLTALLGHTAGHLRSSHGVEPTGSKRDDARSHGEAHGAPNVAQRDLYLYVGLTKRIAALEEELTRLRARRDRLTGTV
jgi:uncharacterized small protein (DUF1192 family)